MDDLDLLRALRDRDTAPPDPAVREAARRRLTEHTAGLPDRSPRAWRRRAAAGGFAAAAAAVAIALLTDLGGNDGGGPGIAVPASAQAAERAAQAALAGAASSDLRPGEYLYIRERQAYLGIAADAAAGGFATIAPQDRETWVARDGSGRIDIKASQEPEFVGPRDRERWEASGRPPLGSGAPGERLDLQPSGFGAGSKQISYEELAALPSDGPAMYERLIELAGDAGPSPDIEAFTIIGDLLRSAPVPRAVRAGLFRAAPLIKGVRFTGPATDRLGREGVAFEIDHDSERRRLIFDPRTAELLAEEQILRERVDYIDAAPGFVTGTRVVLEMAVVGRPGARPPR